MVVEKPPWWSAGYDSWECLVSDSGRVLKRIDCLPRAKSAREYSAAEARHLAKYLMAAANWIEDSPKTERDVLARIVRIVEQVVPISLVNPRTAQEQQLSEAVNDARELLEELSDGPV